MKINVSASRNYDVIVGRVLISHTAEYLRPLMSPATAVIVSDDQVGPLYNDTITTSLESAGIRVLTFTFPHGESSKNSEVLFELLEFMAENGVTRSDLIIALGGGVTGDLTGFAASIYLRGTPFIQIPTTLLAAVDSSVGGKTAINLRSGKNLAGNFNQPRLVLCDIDTLSTLPAQEFASGMAEVIKYGVLSDAQLFELLENEDAHEHLEEIIYRCVASKRDLVMADEFDTGARQLLNLGHTLAHAIERLSDFSIGHGPAVAIGLAAVARCAYATGLAEEDMTARICKLLRKYDLPTKCEYSTKDLCQMILRDKKRSGQTITLVIPRRIGDTYLHKMNVEDLETFYSHR